MDVIVYFYNSDGRMVYMERRAMETWGNPIDMEGARKKAGSIGAVRIVVDIAI